MEKLIVEGIENIVSEVSLKNNWTISLLLLLKTRLRTKRTRPCLFADAVKALLVTASVCNESRQFEKLSISEAANRWTN